MSSFYRCLNWNNQWFNTIPL